MFSIMFQLNDPLEQLDDSVNLDKYKTAGLIATKTVDEIVKLLQPNANLFDIIQYANTFVQTECSKVYKNIKYKGLAYPICLSPNNIAGNFIPKNNHIVSDGDLIKIDLGVHIDGFPSQIGFTTLVTSLTQKITDKRANVLKAVIEASKEIYNIMKVNHTNKDVVKILEKYANKYKCNLPITNQIGMIPGIMSYQTSRYIIDGYNDDDDVYIHKLILHRDNPNYNFTLRETAFEENEIYCINIVMSTGSGILLPSDNTDIFKRNYKYRNELKLKSSKEVLNLFKQPFPITIIDKIPKIKLGLKECIDKKLIEPYPVVMEKSDEFIAQVKFTVVIKNKPILICGKPGNIELDKLNLFTVS